MWPQALRSYAVQHINLWSDNYLHIPGHEKQKKKKTCPLAQDQNPRPLKKKVFLCET